MLMWLLVRVAFWLGVVIVLLPTPPSQPTEPARMVRPAVNPQAGSSTLDKLRKRMNAGRTALGVHTTAPKRKRSRDTLTPADLEMRWMGPQAAVRSVNWMPLRLRTGEWPAQANVRNSRVA
jgi:hypothetical protein